MSPGCIKMKAAQNVRENLVEWKKIPEVDKAVHNLMTETEIWLPTQIKDHLQQRHQLLAKSNDWEQVHPQRRIRTHTNLRILIDESNPNHQWAEHLHRVLLQNPDPTGPDQTLTLATTLDQGTEEIEISTDRGPGTDTIIMTNQGQERCPDLARPMAQTI